VAANPQNETTMKMTGWILLMASAICLHAAEAAKTNSPAAGTNEPPAAKKEAGTISGGPHCSINPRQPELGSLTARLDFGAGFWFTGGCYEFIPCEIGTAG
jgi:hypothetical protein